MNSTELIERRPTNDSFRKWLSESPEFLPAMRAAAHVQGASVWRYRQIVVISALEIEPKPYRPDWLRGPHWHLGIIFVPATVSRLHTDLSVALRQSFKVGEFAKPEPRPFEVNGVLEDFDFTSGIRELDAPGQVIHYWLPVGIKPAEEPAS